MDLFAITALGETSASEENETRSVRLSDANKRLLGALVAAGSAGIAPSDLIDPKSGKVYERPALRMAITRLRRRLPNGAIPEGHLQRYRLELDRSRVDIWALEDLACDPLPSEIEPRVLAHLLRPGVAYRDLSPTPLLEQGQADVDAWQRVLWDRLFAERPGAIDDRLVRLLQAHLDLEPFNDQLLGWLVVSTARAGDRKLALDRFREGHQRYIEAGMQLTPEIADLERQLLDGSFEIRNLPPRPLSQNRALPSELHDLRIGEFVDHTSILPRAIDAVREDAPSLVAINGQSGSGKSRLAAELANALVATHHPFYARPATYDAGVAFGLLQTNLPGFAERVAELDPASMDSELYRSAMRSAATAAFRDLSVAAPALFVIDDWDRLDSHSADLVVHLARLRTIPGLTFVVLLSAAAVKRSDALDQFEQFQLDPFDFQGVLAIVGSIRPELAERSQHTLASALFSAGGGLAGITALVARSASASPFAPALEAIEAADLLVPVLERLSADARLVGLAAAVVGLEFEESTAAAIAGLSLEETVVAIDELMRAGLVDQRDASSFALVHLLVQAAFTRNALAGHVQELHLKAARRWPDDTRRRAWHLAGAGDRAEQGEAVQALIECAEEELTSGLAHEALRAYRRAEEIQTIADPVARGRMARALDLCGERGEADAVRSKAFEEAIGAGKFQDAFEIATSGLPENEPIDGDAELVDKLVRIEQDSAGAVGLDRHRLRVTLARQLAILGRIAEAQEQADLATDTADGPEETLAAAIVERAAWSSVSTPHERSAALAKSEPYLPACPPDRQAEYTVLGLIDAFESGNIARAEELRARLDLLLQSGRTHPIREWHGLLFDAALEDDRGESDRAAWCSDLAYDHAMRFGIEEAPRGRFAAMFVRSWVDGDLAELAWALDDGPISADPSVLSLAARSLITAQVNETEAIALALQVAERVARSPVSQGVAAIAMVAELVGRSDDAVAREACRSLLAARGNSFVVIGAFAASLGPSYAHLAHLVPTDERKPLLEDAATLCEASGLERWGYFVEARLRAS